MIHMSPRWGFKTFGYPVVYKHDAPLGLKIEIPIRYIHCARLERKERFPLLYRHVAPLGL